MSVVANIVIVVCSIGSIVPGKPVLDPASDTGTKGDNTTDDNTPTFTGTAVGFSALCVDLEFTYQFLDDIIGEIAAMTPGPYFHAGGDEVRTLKPEQYRAFIERVAPSR